jgi:hypothetical protein
MCSRKVLVSTHGYDPFEPRRVCGDGGDRPTIGELGHAPTPALARFVLALVLKPESGTSLPALATERVRARGWRQHGVPQPRQFWCLPATRVFPPFRQKRARLRITDEAARRLLGSANSRSGSCKHVSSHGGVDTGAAKGRIAIRSLGR